MHELDVWAERLGDTAKDVELRSLLNRAGDHIEFIETDAEAARKAEPSVQPPTREQIAEAVEDELHRLVHEGLRPSPRHADRIADAMLALIPQSTGDEHHTHDELYEYRMLYNALAANGWAAHGMYPVVKSWRHSDGEECFGGGWFIVVATLPTGQVANHYKAEFWDLFAVPSVVTPPEYDGHTPAEAARRMHALLQKPAPSAEAWYVAVQAKRTEQRSKGYTAEHDREHGVEHLLSWAKDYASRGRHLDAAALVEAAREVLVWQRGIKSDYDVVDEQYRGVLTPEEPVSIADMAPGTTFNCPERWTVGPPNLQGRQWAFRSGEGRYLDEFDLSTIRDVTPPPTTPEEGDRG